MPPNDPNRLNRLEELKSKLFSKDYRTKLEHRDSFSHAYKKEVVDSWTPKETTGVNDEKNFFVKTSRFKKFFIFSLIFFILALAYAAYIFFAGGNTVSNDNIDISILGNNFTAGGESLPLIVEITNKNNLPLELVDLVVEYPKDSSDTSLSDIERLRDSLGTIPAGAVRNDNMNVLLFGEQNSICTLKFSIEYRVAGSNAIFVKEKDYDVSITSTPINLSVDAPPTISPNQDITLNVKATLNAINPVSNILVKLDYPVGFQFASAVPAPSFGNNVWNLGNLSPGDEHDISILGKMVGVFGGEQKTFNISSGSQSSTDKSTIDVVFNSIQSTIAVQKPFIEANLVINGVSQKEYMDPSTAPIAVQIQYANNLDTSVNDFQIVAKLSGNAFDPKTVSASDGFYDSAANTITWDSNSNSEFQAINPGNTGTVAFSVSPLSLYSAAGGMLSNPTISVEVDVAGKQAVQGFATNQLTNSSSADIKIISDVGFSDKALYYSGPFTNTGSIPPKAGQATTYTIVWSLSNTANNISNAQVTSTLPAWMTFVGPFLPANENLIYNPSTREITWGAGNIPTGAGIVGDPRSVSFQVSFTPSLSQVGAIPTILNSATLTGHDDFANVDVTVNKGALNTQLNGDTSFPNNGSIVSD